MLKNMFSGVGLTAKGFLPCRGICFYHEEARRDTKPCGGGFYHEEARRSTKPCGGVLTTKGHEGTRSLAAEGIREILSAKGR